MVLAAFTGQLKEGWKTYKGCMAQGNSDYINSYYGDSDCKDSKEGGLRLVSHHYIDSVASCWAHIYFFFFNLNFWIYFKCSTWYIDSVASYWACGTLDFFFLSTESWPWYKGIFLVHRIVYRKSIICEVFFFFFVKMSLPLPLLVSQTCECQKLTMPFSFYHLAQVFP